MGLMGESGLVGHVGEWNARGEQRGDGVVGTKSQQILVHGHTLCLFERRSECAAWQLISAAIRSTVHFSVKPFRTRSNNAFNVASGSSVVSLRRPAFPRDEADC